jgi:16S rRNA (guanine527-N7)-methyltransferase
VRAPIPNVALTGADAVLAAGLAELGLSTTDSVRLQLVQLATLVERWNARINLSGHRTAEEIAGRLILEALALSRELPPHFDSLVDLGSGAGFPGLPIALTRSETRVLLVESRERRHHFQRAAIRELGLANTTALRGRIEELDPQPGQVVVAQAVAKPARLLELMAPWVEPGGLLVIPGSEDPPHPDPHPGIDPVEIRRYRPPSSGLARTLWIGRRN